MEDKSRSQRPVADLSNLHHVGSVARLTQLASSKQQQQRLTKVTTLDDQTIASYTYDENGLRLTKTVGDTTHEYFYNDEVLDMEVVKVNNTVTEYRSYEWNGYTPLGMMVKAKNGSGTFETNTYQFITNHRGDVLSIRDKDDQEVATYTYDAYGNKLNATGTLAKANPIRYAGYYYDEETKNYYLQARYYNPANGAFLALDPHPGDDDEPLSQNGYSYANGNPVMKVDPNGEVARFVAMGVKKFIKTFKVKKGRKTVTKKKTITSYVYVKLDINTIAKKIPNLKRNKHVLSQSDSFHVFCKRKVQRIATKNTECCHPIFPLFSRQCVC
ncbi:RHS repeat-associated core domain-containing protein [Kurthia sp. YJT4]|uniref:RHS repeat domain-containing protein n=1 Tax=Kurthia sp. YJT4 TaxID=3049086 RepID=UPI002550A087|nr:RHS repeat-associated core domain-containing protein [Kurthia sp. YJT4]WIL40077.1 RHS repeat-associated core domain-containing protein [Kurthia sp. YJT4]